MEIVSNVDNLFSCFLIEIPTEYIKSKLLMDVLAPFKCDAPILPCSDLDNDNVCYLDKRDTQPNENGIDCNCTLDDDLFTLIDVSEVQSYQKCVRRGVLDTTLCDQV